MVVNPKIDELTGLANRDALREFLAEHSNLVSQTKISVALLDIDSFAYVMNQFGWQVGDQALRDIADAIRSETSENNIRSFRIGGDEFVLVLLGDFHLDFLDAVNRILSAIHNMKLPFQGHANKERDRITISMAARSVCLSNVENFLPVLHELDEAIYDAKKKSARSYAVFCAQENIA